MIIAPAGLQGTHEWAERCSNCDNGTVMVVVDYCTAPFVLEVP